MRKRILIVGGGTAGWISAAYLARTLAAERPGGVEITLIESEDIGIVGVGEGTFSSIRKTLKRIALDESVLIRDAEATFKQGIVFRNWQSAPEASSGDSYFHPFQVSSQHTDIDLLFYWLLGVAGDAPWANVSTVQTAVVEAKRAPKLIDQPNYEGPLNYAYHFDAAKLAVVLRAHAMTLGVRRIVDTIDDVRLDENGAIASLSAKDHGDLRADLYLDCTGFRARLIGDALGSEFTSYRDQLFCDRALAIQVPCEERDRPLPSCTYSTAQDSGWIWDIGLQARRGVGYVYSSNHCSDEDALRALRSHVGPGAEDLSPRKLSFEAGFRRIQWRRNCVAIGLSAGFIEPLEATGIGFAEIAALLLGNLFPWSGDYDLAAKQFNAQMSARYAHVIDFIKLHYCLSKRRDSAFWRDNCAPASISDGLHDKLERWRHRPPSFLDVDTNHDIFNENNWQYILYGMGFKTDIGARAGALRYFEEARHEFESIRRQSAYALKILPEHRRLVDEVVAGGFRPPRGARPAKS